MVAGFVPWDDDENSRAEKSTMAKACVNMTLADKFRSLWRGDDAPPRWVEISLGTPQQREGGELHALARRRCSSFATDFAGEQTIGAGAREFHRHCRCLSERAALARAGKLIRCRKKNAARDPARSCVE